jgi:cytochrome c oxidase cbb3-type subunit 2
VNPAPLIFLATFFALATSWLGFVLVPQLQIGRQPQVEVKETGLMYPPRRPGLAKQGAEVYRANGCFYCHSQQVRPEGFGSDVERKWSGRPSKVQSVAQDYLYDEPVMLGSQRVGPDLANIGLRQTNEVWLLTHLYNPQLTSQGSTMPPYRFLFKKTKLKVGEAPSVEALPLDATTAPGYQIVPTEDAKALVAYLSSLHSEAIIFETPSTNAPVPAVTATNAPAGAAGTATNTPSTNAPAK